METTIIEPSPSFQFAPLVLGRPSTLNGSFFSKIHYFNKPLYIQTPKSWTREGFVKMNKKISCDLMFDSNQEDFITWIELLETAVQKLIHQHSSEWFESKMEPSEIESFFKPSLKVYKSGKFYLLKTQIKTHALTHEPLIKIFSEDESVLRMEDIQPNTSILSVLEIQGLKFTTRQFQIEYELKQVMVADVLFESCVIQPQKQKVQNETPTINALPPPNDTFHSMDNTFNPDLNLKDSKENTPEPLYSLKSPLDLEKLSNEILQDIHEFQDEDLKEVVDTDFQLEWNDKTMPPVQLKKPNQRAFEMYKEARKKAKEAKKQSVLAYLEAQQIKQTYLLEDIESSDSEEDVEDQKEE
jgi:hypothetical protein